MSSKTVKAVFTFPDGTTKEFEVPEKQFKTGRDGFYTQIPPTSFDGGLYTGQIQFWKR